MCDHNLNNENNLNSEEKKASSILLRDIAVDFTEQLHNVKVKLKMQEALLKEKEQELGEIERTRVNNLDLFSPIYSKTYDASELKSSITQIKKEISNLNEEHNILNQKISGLKLAAEYIDSMVNNEADNVEANANNKQKLSDKGLSILEAQEIERQRIARDLHDTTVQNLTSLVHKSELCIKLMDIDTVRAKLELGVMSNTLKMIINDMRGIIYNLKPMTLDDLGLTITVQRLANRIMNLNNIQVKVVTNDEIKDILPVIKLTVFRIIQEACNNVIKHANASFINVDIKYDESNVTVNIKDNGKGFDIDNTSPNSSEQSSSFGLSIMKERISLLSGTLEIISKAGIGTNITISVPLTTCEEEK